MLINIKNPIRFKHGKTLIKFELLLIFIYHTSKKSIYSQIFNNKFCLYFKYFYTTKLLNF